QVWRPGFSFSRPSATARFLGPCEVSARREATARNRAVRSRSITIRTMRTSPGSNGSNACEQSEGKAEPAARERRRDAGAPSHPLKITAKRLAFCLYWVYHVLHGGKRPLAGAVLQRWTFFLLFHGGGADPAHWVATRDSAAGRSIYLS